MSSISSTGRGPRAALHAGLCAAALAVVAACGDPAGPEGRRVGPDGGTVTFADGRVVLDVPAGALQQGTEITVAPTDAVPASPLLVPSTAYVLGPAGLTFSIAATLRVAYDPDRLPTGVSAAELGLVRVVDGKRLWVAGGGPVAGSSEAAGPVLIAGTYAVQGLEVTTVVIRPGIAEIAVGDTLPMEAIPRGPGGQLLSTRPVTWASADTTVASVSPLGRVAGVGIGQVTITARSGEAAGTAQVDVAPSVGRSLGFLGYLDTSEGQTVCGTCHADRQATWERTGHARAWGTLVNSGQALTGCGAAGCHRLSGRGNTLPSDAVTTGIRYEDVQCEACHGPGAAHVERPTEVFPLSFIGVGRDLDVGCGECHVGPDQPYLELWERSGHALVPNQAAIIAADDPTCLPCHEGKAAIRDLFGKVSNYREINDGRPQPIVCAVCHDPMGSPHENNARAPLDDEAEHLCLQCHARRAVPPSPTGPHGAQGLLLLGRDVGWIPPGFESVIDLARNATSHRRTNPRLCITCHMPLFTVAGQSGAQVYRAVGHSFEAIPCLDERGIPTPGPCAVEQRYFQACSNANCHLTPEFARDYDFLANRTRINGWLDQIWNDLDGDQVIDATDQGLLPQVVALGDTSLLDVRDAIVTVPEGALWNAQVAHTDDRLQFSRGQVFGIPFSSSPTSGNGAHNPAFLDALLDATVKALQAFLDAR